MRLKIKIAAIIATSIYITGSFVVFAKTKNETKRSSIGGVNAKVIPFKAESNPKYSDEYKSKRISKLIGHKTDWSRINDVRHDANKLNELYLRGKPYNWSDLGTPEARQVEFEMGEECIDPSMVNSTERRNRKEGN